MTSLSAETYEATAEGLGNREPERVASVVTASRLLHNMFTWQTVLAITQNLD